MAIFKSITSSDVILALSVPGLFDFPQIIQGFATDDISDFGETSQSETVMGADGFFTAGFIYMPTSQSISLLADSDSNDFFDAWVGAQEATGRVYYCRGTMVYPSLNKTIAMTRGVLGANKKAPDAKKTLQPRKWSITWGKVSSAPI